jgi:uncharacterized repeat protein (TIGR01451 family)
MKNIYFFVLLLAHLSLSSQIVNIPDPQFKAKLVSANQWNFIATDLSGNATVIDTNNDGEIQVSEALNISSLNFNQTQISNLTGIKSFTNLTTLTAQLNSQLEEIDVSNMVNLKYLTLNNNGLDAINTQGCIQLEQFNLINNYGFISSLAFLQNSSLKRLTLINNNYLASADLSAFPALEELTISGTSYVNSNFTSLNLTNNVNLKKIIIEKPNLTSLTLNPLSHLLEFTLKKTQLTSLNLSSAGFMTYLYLDGNPYLTSVNIQNCNSLENLQIVNNLQLSNLNIQNKPTLTAFSCMNTNISSLNFTGTPNIINLSLSGNAFTSLDLAPISGLIVLNFSENHISSLDLSQNTALQGLSVLGNSLTNINLKNGSSTLIFNPSPSNYLPNLAYVCCDTNKVQYVYSQLSAQGLGNVEVNSYCSFAPGGTSYAIQGNVKYDYNNNGCDANDQNKAFELFNISGGGTTGSTISNNSGNYNFAVPAGSYTITPVLENPAYFNISPTTLTANFPTQTSPLHQNFCMTANGTHNDLEVIIIPLTGARPGFDAKYKIIYKNKGTTPQSGNLVYNFDDNVMNFMSSTVAPSSQSTGILNWNFTNLLPFETKEIVVTLKLNTPTQTPALNGGDVLHYTAQINGGTDETPTDNAFALNQTVVNSFDPNDKTCLEGTSITQTQVGDYVHYMIRFENTGSANAENIVVKDVIDPSKFDITTLRPISGSHNFTTNVTNPNIVEFIFENVQLPFDDANNDGYITFKIKTKATLALGDSFSNTANIYFDYNHPIVTNTFTTTVQNVLATTEINNDKTQFSVYPNPVQDVLFIKSKEKVVKAEIYDAAGRILNSTSPTNNSINVSELAKGNYIIKLSTKDKTVTQKFIKN